MQKLEVYQSLWAMEMRRADVPEDSFEEKFARIAASGYAGVCLDPGVDEINSSMALKPLYDKHGLGVMVNAFPYKVRELKPILEMAKTMEACMVNVIGGVMPVNVAGAIPVLYRWMEDADDVGVPLLIETHRDGILSGVEQCDDGNTVSGDGCSADCMAIEPGWNCPAPGAPCEFCGNGILEPHEECDEGPASSW